MVDWLSLPLGLNPLILKSLPSVWYRITIPRGTSLQIRWSMAASRVIANRLGAMMHPCLIPVCSLQVSDSMPLLLSTVADMSSCSNLKTQMYLSEQPYLDSVLHGSWQSKVWKTFVRSMKTIYNGCLLFLLFLFFWGGISCPLCLWMNGYCAGILGVFLQTMGAGGLQEHKLGVFLMLTGMSSLCSSNSWRWPLFKHPWAQREVLLFYLF